MTSKGWGFSDDPTVREKVLYTGTLLDGKVHTAPDGLKYGVLVTADNNSHMVELTEVDGVAVTAAAPPAKGGSRRRRNKRRSRTAKYRH